MKGIVMWFENFFNCLPSYAQFFVMGVIFLTSAVLIRYGLFPLLKVVWYTITNAIIFIIVRPYNAMGLPKIRIPRIGFTLHWKTRLRIKKVFKMIGWAFLGAVGIAILIWCVKSVGEIHYCISNM